MDADVVFLVVIFGVVVVVVEAVVVEAVVVVGGLGSGEAVVVLSWEHISWL